MRFLLTVLTTICFASPALARTPAHIIEQLQVVVEDSVPAGSEVKLTRVEVRGKLPRDYTLELRCDPLRVTRIRALIRAGGKKLGWVTAIASIRIPALVVANDIPRGSNVAAGVSVQLVDAREVPRNAVRPGDLRAGPGDLRAGPGDLRAGPEDLRAGPEDLEEVVASRDLRAGKVIASSDIVLPKLIDRGQPVELTVRRGSVVVAVRGVALNSGRRGDLVRVKTSGEGRTIEGVVVGPGTCEVP